MISIIVPTYNEKDNVKPLADLIGHAIGTITEYEILYVDDSTDETPEVLAELSEQDSHVRYIHREGEKGLAAAVLLGFDEANGDILTVIDADLQHPPELLARMYEEIEKGADIVLPSRYIADGEKEGLNFIRSFVSISAKKVAQALLPPIKKISDPLGGYFMFRKSVVKGIELDPIGWKILLEILTLGTYERVVEIPYKFQKRNAGESKLNFKVSMDYFRHVLLLRKRRKQKIRGFDN